LNFFAWFNDSAAALLLALGFGTQFSTHAWGKEVKFWGLHLRLVVGAGFKDF